MQKRRIHVACWLGLLGTFGCFADGLPDGGLRPPAQPAVDEQRIRVTLGERITLLSDGSLGLHYFPDMAVTVLQRAPRMRLLLAAGVSSFLVEGFDLQHLGTAREVLRPAGSASFDNGYAGISGVVRLADGKLYAIYHAEDHRGMPRSPGGIPGFYASVALAESGDGGDTWVRHGPIITSTKPKEWTWYPGQWDRGAGEPGLVAEVDGRHLFAYYTEHSRIDGRHVQICMARADLTGGPPLPGRWHKYSNGAFGEPGLGGKDTPVISAARLDEANALFPHATYSSFLKKYVMIFNVDRWKEHAPGVALMTSGIYAAYSNDGITWSEPAQLILDYSVPLPGKSLSWEGTVLWDDDRGRDGWLVYGYSERWGSDRAGAIPHYMVGRRIRFDRPESQHVPNHES